MIGEPEWRGFEAVSDLAWIAEAGIPGLLYGPGDTMQAHSTAEYVDVEELVAATKVVALRVDGLVRHQRVTAAWRLSGRPSRPRPA